MYIDINYIDNIFRSVLPLPSEHHSDVIVEAWLEDDRRYNFIYEKIYHNTKHEAYCIGWELINVKEI